MCPWRSQVAFWGQVTASGSLCCRWLERWLPVQDVGFLLIKYLGSLAHTKLCVAVMFEKFSVQPINVGWSVVVRICSNPGHLQCFLFEEVLENIVTVTLPDLYCEVDYFFSSVVCTVSGTLQSLSWSNHPSFNFERLTLVILHWKPPSPMH